MKIFIYICLAIASNTFLFAQSKHIHTETSKIQFLLIQLDKPNLKFIRNGEEFSGKEAREHMQKKLDYAGNKIVTVNDFISKIATKSYLTGNKYYVQLPDGKKIESEKWLRETLKKLE